MSPGSATWLAVRFAVISVVAVGGANAVIPDMHRQLVVLHPLLSEADFGALVALAQAAPGPNAMVAGVLGFRVGGTSGALGALVGMSLFPIGLSVALSRLRGRQVGAAWQRRVARALAPLSVGLVLASAYTLLASAGLGWLGVAIAAGVAVLRLHSALPPLVWLAAAAGLAVALG